MLYRQTSSWALRLLLQKTALLALGFGVVACADDNSPPAATTDPANAGAAGTMAGAGSSGEANNGAGDSGSAVSGADTTGAGTASQGAAGSGSAGDGASAGGVNVAGSTTAAGAGNAGATGEVPDPPSTGSGLASCTDPEAIGPSPIRRIETLEYVNAVRDVLGASINEGSLPSDEKLGTFVANVTLPMIGDHVDRYRSAARTVAAAVVPGFAALSGCASSADSECTLGFLNASARRLFHGTLVAEEEARIADIYTSLVELDADLALHTALEYLLLSPRFLYLVEFGSTNGARAKLSGSEVAGRLAAFLWRSVPTPELLAAADGGALDTADGVRAQARTMLSDAKATEVLVTFAQQWLRVASPAAGADELEQEAASEVGLYLAQALNDPAITFDSLMRGYPGPTTPALSAFYGDGEPRNSVLMTAGYLSTNATGEFPSSVKRGYVIRTALLCTPIALPSNPTNMNLEVTSDTQTAQEVFAAHSANPECWGCHQNMDPLGDAFGQYDAQGAFDANTPGDTSGEIVGFTENNTFAGAAELADILAESSEAQSCFMLQSTRFALGRGEGPGDACGLQDLLTRYAGSNYSVQELLVEITGSDLFLNRNPVVAGGQCR